MSPRSLQNIQRTFDIRIYICVGRVVRIRNRNQRSQVQNNLLTFDCFIDTVRVANVAGEDVDAFANCFVTLVQPSPRIKRVVEHEGSHLMSVPDQRLDDM